jgi:spoIIIJ-associated protein
MGILIGYRGETLDSLQYLVSLVINKGHETAYKRVVLDTENYRSKREETLKRLAQKVASTVRRTGKNVRLEPMNPYERRIIHSALQDDRYVKTYSEGEEPYRRVVVDLKKA